MKKYFLAFFVLTLIISAGSVLAQTKFDTSLYDKDGFMLRQPNFPDNKLGSEKILSKDDPILKVTTQTIDKDGVKAGEIASCFDYYSFGSVGVNLTTNLKKYNSGDPIVINGTVHNKNKYPVIGIDIKARLVKNIPNPKQMRAEISVLDEFDVAKNITIPANEEYKITYTHLLPTNAPSGQYEVMFYAVEQGRFNMAGLSFTNDILASSLSFAVVGNKPDYIYLDQTKITVGGQPHNVMGFMTKNNPDVEIPISIPLYNPSTEKKEMKITYNLYSWDSANPKNKIDTKTEIVSVPAKSEYKLSYKIAKAEIPVYYLSVVSEPNKKTADSSVFSEKTISNIRLAVIGKSKPRLNFLSVDTYPLKKEQEATLVTCFHNTNSFKDSNISRIETVLRDDNGKEITKTIFEGKTISDITGLINKFKPKKDLANFSIESTMYDSGNNIIDSVVKKYICEDLNKGNCTKSNSDYPMIPVVAVAAVIILGLIAVAYKKKNLNLSR